MKDPVEASAARYNAEQAEYQKQCEAIHDDVWEWTTEQICEYIKNTDTIVLDERIRNVIIAYREENEVL